MIDLHSHIIPNVDDGAETLDVSIDMLAIAAGDGVTDIVATPHFIPGSFAPTGPEVRVAVATLQDEADSRGIAIRVHAGHEVRAGAGLVSRLRSGEVLAYDAGRHYLLLEMPGAQVPEWMDQLAFELQVAGVVPVLAHPERNLGIIRNPMRLHSLIEKGCRTQITAGSLLGHFGRSAQEVTKVLLEHDMVHIVASDAHDNHFRLPILSEARQAIGALLDSNRARVLFEDHPRAILDGNDFDAPEPRPLDKKEEAGLFDRVLKLFQRDE